MIIDIFFDALKDKNVEVVEKNTLAKFTYKNQKFSVRVSKVCFAYRKNKDEYRVQVNEENREKLRSMHISGYWSVIFGYHEKTNTFTAWDNKLLFSSRAKNRSMYTRESLLFKVNDEKFESYIYEDQFLKKNTISISMKPENIFYYLDIIKNSNIHREQVFKQINNSMIKN